MYVYDILHHYMQQTLKQEVVIYKILQLYLLRGGAQKKSGSTSRTFLKPPSVHCRPKKNMSK